MQKVVILGATEGVVKAIEEIRSTDQTSEITFLALDGQYPYNPHLFLEYINKEASLSQVLCKPKDFYEKNKVKVILDKKITKISFKKHKIALSHRNSKNKIPIPAVPLLAEQTRGQDKPENSHVTPVLALRSKATGPAGKIVQERKRVLILEDNEAMEYDILLITDPPSYRFPDIKGVQREGVFGVKRFKDIQGMVKLFPIVETIVIQAEDVNALKFVFAFLKMEKEIVVISPNPEIFSSLALEENKWIPQALEEGKLRFLKEYPIAEILGDEDVKAVRLQSGKVIATQMVIFFNTPEDFKLFVDSPLKINKKICVNAEFKTNIENVLAVHEACETP